MKRTFHDLKTSGNCCYDLRLIRLYFNRQLRSQFFFIIQVESFDCVDQVNFSYILIHFYVHCILIESEAKYKAFHVKISFVCIRIRTNFQ